MTSYGAKGDGKNYDTDAVRAACTALSKVGGGTLLFPASRGGNGDDGPKYLTGSFNLSSNTQLVVEAGATVLGSTRGDDWPLVLAREVWPQFGHGSDCSPGDRSCEYMHQAFIFAWNQVNITIEGQGTIDANANKDTWWKCAKDLSEPPCNGYGRPHFMMMSNVTGMTLRDVTVKNSPDWTLHMSSVTNLLVQRVRVLNPSDAPNSDGIDLDCVQNALVEDSYFDVGDDALCVKSGIDWFGRQYARPSKNIMFRNIIVGSGHGISIGSESSGGVYNVTFENISMKGTERGPRIKSQRGRGGLVDTIVFRNITADGLETAISFTLNYHSDIKPTNESATPRLQNVLVENCKFTGVSEAGEFDGLGESHIKNITLRDVVIEGSDKFKKCDNIDGGRCEGKTTICPPCFEDHR